MDLFGDFTIWLGFFLSGNGGLGDAGKVGIGGGQKLLAGFELFF